jgi:putative endonuclease
MKTYYVYILSSSTGVLYTGVTSNLSARITAHKTKALEGFTKKYNVNRLIYCEATNDVNAAIVREKQIKGWSRKKKLDLARTINPTFKDLSEEWIF